MEHDEAPPDETRLGSLIARPRSAFTCADRMPMRIAVLAASNPGYLNPGMLTVDLAAAGVLARAVPTAALSWYTLHPPEQLTEVHRYVNPSHLPFRWQPLQEHFDEVCRHDLIVLWGDFLQARHYFVEDATSRLMLSSASGISSRTAALELLYRCRKTNAGAEVAAAWDEFVEALDSRSIEGLHIGCYSSGVLTDRAI